MRFSQETREQDRFALCFMGPDTADLEHVLTIVRAGYFRPDRMILVLNENLVPSHRVPRRLSSRSWSVVNSWSCCLPEHSRSICPRSLAWTVFGKGETRVLRQQQGSRPPCALLWSGAGWQRLENEVAKGRRDGVAAVSEIIRQQTAEVIEAARTRHGLPAR